MKNLINLQPIKKMFSVRVIKVTLAFFIFASLMINIIAPKNIENKEQIFSVVCLVLNDVIVKTIRGCTDTLIVMSSKITKDLCKLLMPGDEVGTKVPVKDEKKDETPVNTSSDIGIETTGRLYKELVRYTQEEELIVLSVGKIVERLYRLYGNVKVYCGQLHGIFILFFIIFIVAIRERKEDIENQINFVLKNKTNLC
jgi:hypothetical protein